MRARTLPALLLALAGCSGPALFAEVELPLVEVALPQHTFPASVADPILGNTLTSDFRFDVGSNLSIISEPNVDYDLQLRSLTIELTNATSIGNFDGFQELHLVVLAPVASGLSDLPIVDYVNGSPGATRITIASATAADLKPYLEAGAITVRAQVRTSGPTPSFNADVTAELYVRVRLDYGAYL